MQSHKMLPCGVRRKCPLIDGKGGHRFDAKELRFKLLPFVGMRGVTVSSSVHAR
jgi:hypothetical protein